MYIRTKIGIFEKEIPNKDNDFLVEDEKRILTTGGGLINKKSIIKQSENLEELCDGFVVVGNEHIVFQTVTFDRVKLAFANKNYEIYGAIWTDKGLIYVAKMNDKGELVLI